MTPKIQYTKALIVDKAFEIAKEEGIDYITMRKVAKKIGGSVAPIYVNFQNIGELKEAVVRKIFDVSREFYKKYQTGNPFSDIGVASIKFAKEYRVIFRDLVLKYNDHMKNYDEEMAFLIDEMKKDPALRDLTDDELKQVYIKMRVFQLGLSMMTANDLLPKTYTDEMIIELLESTAKDVIYSTLHNRNK